MCELKNFTFNFFNNLFIDRDLMTLLDLQRTVQLIVCVEL